MESKKTSGDELAPRHVVEIVTTMREAIQNVVDMFRACEFKRYTAVRAVHGLTLSWEPVESNGRGPWDLHVRTPTMGSGYTTIRLAEAPLQDAAQMLELIPALYDSLVETAEVDYSDLVNKTNALFSWAQKAKKQDG